MKKFVNGIIGIVLLIMCIMNCILVRDLKEKTLELIELTDLENELIIVDSIEYDTVYFNHFDSVRLETIKKDTIIKLDSVIVFDSVDVVIPIEINHYQDTLLNTAISFDIIGFQCKVDNLYLRSMKVPTIEQKAPKKWGLGVSLGVGATKDGFSPFIGLGISYDIFSF